MSANEIVCPSGFAFIGRKLTGRMFAALAAAAEVDELSSTVAACCVRVDDPGPYALGAKDGLPNWKTVITGDLATAFIRLRAISIPPSHDGEVFKWKLTCTTPTCLDERGKPNEYFWTVRLDEVPVVQLTADARARVKAGNVFPGKLLDGRAMTFKLPTDGDGAVIRQLLRDAHINLRNVASGDAATVIRPYTVASVVLSIDGVHADNVRDEVLDLDPWSQADIQRQVSEVDGGFDSFKGRCPHCNAEPDLALPFIPRLLLSLESTELKAPPKAPPAESKQEPLTSSAAASPA